MEEITRKTGNFKKFAIFVKMLEAGVRQGDEGVYLEVLSSADLQALKSKKNPSDVHASSNAHTSHNHKRYLILTHEAQFDRCLAQLHTIALFGLLTSFHTCLYTTIHTSTPCRSLPASDTPDSTHAIE